MKAVPSYLFLLFFSFLISCQDSSVQLLKNGKTGYSIYLQNSSDESVIRAAEVFQETFLSVSGTRISISEKEKSRAIILSKDSSGELGNDGFRIETQGSNLLITGGSDRGVIYGVYTFFEKYADCRWLTKDVTILPQKSNWELSEINFTEIPVIKFREDYYSHSKDSIYREAHKLDSHFEEWGYWVHTFFSFLSPEDYFEEHPEYFAEVNGKRTPHSQLCLSNPEVLEIVSKSLGKKIQENPEAKYWSVSQMDTFGFCTCENCLEIDREEGSPSGTILRFVNELAKRFPDKTISTLAYQYSRKPPKISKPENNVNIMFCSIELNRSEPIETDSTSSAFRNDLESWRELTDNVMTWDYVIQFSNLFAPFPNLHVLQPNLQYFVENNAIAHFQQGNREIGGEMNELRAYLIAKLLWDPYLNIDSVKMDFLKNYYGPAANHIDEYIELTHNELLKSGYKLDIFGNPAHHASGFLSMENFEKYETIFDNAEASVADDKDYLYRVRSARLAPMFAKLEIGKRHAIGDLGVFEREDDKWKMKEEYSNLLEVFTERLKERNVERLMEWHTNPDDYYANYPRELQTDFAENLATGGEVIYETKYHHKFPSNGEGALIDGLSGTKDLNSFWQGWEVDDMEVIIDLKNEKSVKSITASFLHSPGNWIFLPNGVTISVSEDGKSFENVLNDKTNSTELNNMQVRIKEIKTSVNRKVRYIKVRAENVGQCPTDNCKGGDAWVFCDEIRIN